MTDDSTLRQEQPATSEETSKADLLEEYISLLQQERSSLSTLREMQDAELSQLFHLARDLKVYSRAVPRYSRTFERSLRERFAALWSEEQRTSQLQAQKKVVAEAGGGSLSGEEHVQTFRSWFSSLRMAFLTALGIVFVASSLLWWQGSERREAQLLSTIDTISPSNETAVSRDRDDKASLVVETPSLVEKNDTQPVSETQVQPETSAPTTAQGSQEEIPPEKQSEVQQVQNLSQQQAMSTPRDSEITGGVGGGIFGQGDQTRPVRIPSITLPQGAKPPDMSLANVAQFHEEFVENLVDFTQDLADVSALASDTSLNFTAIRFSNPNP